MRPALAVSSLVVVAVLSACAEHKPAPVAIPEAIKGAPGETLAAILPAKGVQIYECRAKTDQPSAYEWTFVGPEADLFNTAGIKVGRHYGGPTWEAADGSKVVGAAKARADMTGTIPWLLLTATPSGQSGVFSKVSSIQRVNTIGGTAPSAPCAQANAGDQARIPYTADYYLLSRS